jgi:hypothetical protein
MGLFTSNQANACIIKKVEKLVKGSDVSWLVGVRDTDNNYYDIMLTGLGANPSTSDIKTASIAEIVKKEKEPARIIRTVTRITDKGLGETLG